jgi:putative ABC transport system permease protein
MDESMKDDFIGVFPVDDNFLEFYDIPLLAGRDFPAYGGMEAREYFIINEAALERLKLENPEDAIGRPFELIFGWPEIFRGGEIIGVSENFHFYTLKEEIKPMVMFQKHIWFWNFLVRLNQSEIPAALEYIREKWDELYPDYPFEYRFVDDLYRDLYRHEIRQARILGVLSVLTVIIACLGLVGLMHYLAGIRTREIGIRKVNGARPVNILILLNREFIQLILLSLVIGIPLAIYLLDQWLRNFVYRIDLQWWIPVLTGLGFLLISLLTVTYQSWAAAARNPLASLRYE